MQELFFSGGGEVIGNVGLAVGLGLLLGKFLGIYLFTWLTIKSGLARMPEGMNWKNIAGVSLLGGVGFTVSLFIANLSFSDAYPELLNQAKFGVLCGTIIAGILGYVVLNQVLPKKKKSINKSTKPIFVLQKKFHWLKPLVPSDGTLSFKA